ncbi:MAG: hypothetical protein AAGH99_00320 [Planctomycetota bacterium]
MQNCDPRYATVKPIAKFRNREWFATLQTEHTDMLVRLVPVRPQDRCELDTITNAHDVNTLDMEMAYANSQSS